MKTTEWWENLDEAQMKRYGDIIDSRTRLLGESYPRAVNAVQQSTEAKKFVLGEE